MPALTAPLLLPFSVMLLSAPPSTCRQWSSCVLPIALQQPAKAAAAGATSGVAQTEPAARALLESSSEQWGKAAALPGVAVALELLAAVAKGHQASCSQLVLDWAVTV